MLKKLQLLIVFLGSVCAQHCTGQSPLAGLGNVSTPFGTRYVDGHPDRRFVGQLIEMGFHEPAIELCQRRRSLAESGQDLNEKAHWRMLCMESEAAKTASELMKNSDTLPTIDTQIKSIAESFPMEQSDPRSLWVQYKSSWCQWYVLRSGVSVYLAAPGRTPLKDWCLKRIRIALDDLEELESGVAKTPTTGVSFADKIGANDLNSLTAEINLLACDLLSLRGMIYPAKSDERLAAGTQMLSVLEKAERRIGSSWSDRPKLQIAKCRALLLLDRPKDALSASASLFALPQLRREWTVAIAAIGSEAARDLGDFDTSFRWIRDAGGWESNPLLAIEQFATTLANEKMSSADEALRIKKLIAERFGGYWASRTDALLVTTKGNIPNPNTKAPSNALAMELLLSETKQLIADKRWEDAVEKLSQGESIAANEKNEELAHQMAKRSAAIWGSLGEFENAANEFHRAATTYPNVPQSPAASMTAVRMIQEGLQRLGQESNQLALEKRESLLQLRKQIWLDVMTIWPESEQSAAAVESLQDFYLSNDQLWEANQLWMERWDRLLRFSTDRPTKDNSFANQELQSAIQHSVVLTSLLCLLSQQSWLDSSLVGVEAQKKANDILLRLLETSEKSDRSERNSLRARLQPMATGAGWEWSGSDFAHTSALPSNLLDDWLECKLLYLQIVSSIPPTPEKIKSLSASVERLSQGMEGEQSKRLGKLTKDELTRSIELYRIAAKGWSGDPEGAKIEFERIEKESMRNAWWPYQSARFMQSIPSLREDSLVRFRRVASGLQPSSEGWYECRARTVQTLRMLQRKEEADQLAGVIIATSPSISPLWISRLETRK